MKQSIFMTLSVIFSLTGILQANPADIYPTGKVDMVDFAVFTAAWLGDNTPTANWNPDCDISDPSDGFIDEIDLEVLAANWLWTALDDMVWVYIEDPGVDDTGDSVPGHEAFNGYMSKYETTNAQYCLFLNDAIASGDITVSDNRVYGANGSNDGADFVGEKYCDTFAADSDSQIIYNGGVFIIRSRDGYDMSNHPVVEVSWYGATAFCNYYEYRLPTEWEWQAIADYDGSYDYGCGTTIDQSKANYFDGDYANPLALSSDPYTTPVDYYSSYGYGMNDMAGNVWEWTSSCYYVDCDFGYRFIRGGSWCNYASYCTVTYRILDDPFGPGSTIGFRVCR